MKKTVFSIVTVVALGGFGMAGGDIAPVTPAPVDNWSGFYGGMQVGYVWNDADVDYHIHNLDGSLRGTSHAPDMNVDGNVLGLYGGYNFLLQNNILIGVEGEINMVGAKDTVHTIHNGNKGRRTFTDVEQNWDAALLLKTGVVMEDYLPYLIGGVAWGNFDITKHNRNGRVLNADMTLSGWTVGAGLEMVLTENLHARLQYRYTDYGDKTVELVRYRHSYTDVKLDVKPSHMVTIGLSFKF